MSKYTRISEIEQELAECNQDDLNQYTYREGHHYKGYAKSALKHGIGVFTWPNKKAKYIGEFRKDFRHGFGKLIQTDGSVYVGFWKND